MTIGTLKKETLTLIEEYNDNIDYTDDEDLAKKLNSAINTIQLELATTVAPYDKKVDVSKTDEDDLEYTLPSDFYKLNMVKECSYELYPTTIEFNNKYVGTIKLRYWAYPTRIEDTTADSFSLEIDRSAQEIMKYGVASELLKADLSSNYSIYEAKYQNLKANLSTTRSKGIGQIKPLPASINYFE